MWRHQRQIGHFWLDIHLPCVLYTSLIMTDWQITSDKWALTVTDKDSWYAFLQKRQRRPKNSPWFPITNIHQVPNGGRFSTRVNESKCLYKNCHIIKTVLGVYCVPLSFTGTLAGVAVPWEVGTLLIYAKKRKGKLLVMQNGSFNC